ncbi:MAG: hypothetical protein IAI50_00740 [Candidatus Eremiobacteraeota bacterium]|nr:hypothetical protein [Candidatus Eremiobacteraeota bacterium]
MAISAVDVIGDVIRLRSRAARFLAVLICAHVPLVAAMAIYNHTGWPLQTSIAAVLALGACAAAWFRPTALTTRLIISASLTGMPILFVLNGAGPWQIDYHMYFFAIFAMLVAFCDWRPIVLSATLTIGHHVVLDLFDRPAVFPSEGGVARLALHGAIVAVECGVLIWIIAQVRSLFLASARSRALAEIVWRLRGLRPKPWRTTCASNRR